MIRVLRVHNRLVVGGPLTHVTELSLGLSNSFETLLVAGQAEDHEQDMSAQLKDRGLNIKIISSLRRSPGVLHDIRAFLELFTLIRQYRPHIVHTHGAKSGFLARLAARILHVPVIVHTYHGHTFHSYFGWMMGRLFLVLERLANQWSDAVLVLSEGQKNDICLKYKACKFEKALIVPLGFDVEAFAHGREERGRQFRDDYGIPQDVVLLGWIGRMVAVKDPLLFLDAVAEARDKGADFKAIMIGDGPMQPEIEAAVRVRSLQETVLLTSWISPPEVALSAIDILMLTSRNEGTPLSILEAQASGIPIISTDAGGAGESFLPGGSGLLMKTRDAGELSHALQVLLSDPDLRKEMGSKGQAFVRMKHSREGLLHSVEAIYRDLLRSKGIERN